MRRFQNGFTQMLNKFLIICKKPYSSKSVILSIIQITCGRIEKEHPIYYFICPLKWSWDKRASSTVNRGHSLTSMWFFCSTQKTLHDHWPKFFTALAMASYNDTSTKCRKLVIVALKMLLGKVSTTTTRLKYCNAAVLLLTFVTVIDF